MSHVRNVLLQVLAVGAYFALVAMLYWRELTNAGAVAIILGLLFLFKSVVDSGVISLKRLSPSDPEFRIGSPEKELLKALSFFGVGVGAWIDLVKALETGLVPGNLPTAVIHLMLVCIFAICVVCCFARFTAAMKNRPRR
jgi:Na+/proline symporter